MEGNTFLILFISFIISVITHYIIIKIAHKRGIFIDDHESNQPQKFHDSPTPRVGGLGVFLACLLFAYKSEVGLPLLICSIPAFLSGFFEDLFGNISPKNRLVIMAISALIAIFYLDVVVMNFGIFHAPYAVGVAISFIAILGLINGTNMIDGYNGLLSGTSIIIFSAFAYVCYQENDIILCIINLILVAGLLGFVLFNYPKGFIFLGDGGAYFLGFVMAVIGMLIAKRNPGISPFFVLICISYPVMEVIFSFVRKGLIMKTSPLEPDGFHFHMLVNKVLLKKRNYKTVMIILPIVLIFNILGIIFYNNQLALMLGTLGFIGIYIIFYGWLKKKNKRA
jgi:UDP-N-acetylmuramyl pentapeptide phosphotransferase/UDP-N-acetylglucosamine-1-phosphate transferase